MNPNFSSINLIINISLLIDFSPLASDLFHIWFKLNILNQLHLISLVIKNNWRTTENWSLKWKSFMKMSFGICWISLRIDISKWIYVFRYVRKFRWVVWKLFLIWAGKESWYLGIEHLKCFWLMSKINTWNQMLRFMELNLILNVFHILFRICESKTIVMRIENQNLRVKINEWEFDCFKIAWIKTWFKMSGINFDWYIWLFEVDFNGNVWVEWDGGM